MNTDGEEGTGKSQMGRGHWVTDSYYYRTELSETDKAVTMRRPPLLCLLCFNPTMIMEEYSDDDKIVCLQRQ